MRRIRATVSGRVQGVFFRDMTQQTARELGLTGWVRNERDGSVVVEAQGDDEGLERLERWLHEGPSRAEVAGVETAGIDLAAGERDFVVG